ncbi:hypothetical protein [Streptomyces coeruleofuscus]|uniref:Uncharacterized protein n=1 Tax=Streptomyces coeruleofuscus TaxID=66879 RepID=A0ABP5UNU1_9ACTN
MGDRLSRDGITGRRRVCPGEAVAGPWDPRDDTALHTVLVAALLAGDPDPEAERRAVAAFRTARDTGEHRARTRYRDDWRLPARRRTGHPVKTTAAAVFTSIALGGVAVGAIGSNDSSVSGTGEGTHPSVLTPARPGDESSSASSGVPGRRDGSPSAQDTEAHCRAFERVEDRGRTLDATAWQRLVAAAGGEDEVDGYCAARLARPTTAPSRSGVPGRPPEGAGTVGKGGSTPGNGNPGNGPADGGKG